jgi:hypothetical protein
MKRQKWDKITPEIEETMFSMWLSGLGQKEIADIFASKGMKTDHIRVSKISVKHRWSEKKKEILAASEETMKQRQILSKVKKSQAFSAAVDVLSETIKQDYLDYKKDPEKFKLDVAEQRRRRPIWQVKDVYEAAALIETESKIYAPDKEASVVINNSTTNNAATLNVLSEADSKTLIELMAKAKLQTWEKTTEDATKLIEGEVTEQKVEDGKSE